MHLSVIIPAYNEEKRIGKTLQSIGEYLSRQSYEWEVLVINNNSKDNTVGVAKEWQAKYPKIRVIDEPQPGKGHAVTRGMMQATGDYRVFTDADNSTSIDHIEKMMPYFKEGFDVVIGSIAIKGHKIVAGGQEPLWRIILGKLGNKWIQVFAVWGINDTQRGFKVCSARAAQDIFPLMTIFGWGFDVEMLAIAKVKKYKIKEVPITWDNDPDSKVNIWAYPQVLMQTLLVFWNKLMGRYK